MAGTLLASIAGTLASLLARLGLGAAASQAGAASGASVGGAKAVGLGGRAAAAAESRRVIAAAAAESRRQAAASGATVGGARTVGLGGQAAAAAESQASLLQKFGKMGAIADQVSSTGVKARQQQQHEDALKEAKAQALKTTKRLTFGILGMSLAMIGLPKAIQKVTERLTEKARALEQFGGAIAIASQNLEAQRLARHVHLASMTGASSTRLMRSQNDLEKAMLPYKVMSTNVLNDIAAAANRATAFAVSNARAISAKFDLLMRLLELWYGEANPMAVPWVNFINDLSNGDVGRVSVRERMMEERRAAEAAARERRRQGRVAP